MRNGTVSLLLLIAVGLNGPTWTRANTVQSQKDSDHSASLPSGSCYVGLGTSIGQATGIKTNLGSAFLARVSPIFDWRSAELVDVVRRTTNALTLQSQHVLLRI